VTKRTVLHPIAILFAGLALSVAALVSAGEYRTTTVETRTLGSVASVGATVVPFEEITFTAQIPGRMELMAGGEGSFFKQGEVIARIDDEEIKAQRQAALAEIRNAEAALRNAGVQLQRERTNPTPTNQNMMDQFMPMNPMSMFGNRSDTYVDRRANLYSQGTAVEQARGRVVQARSRLTEIEAKMNDTKSVAPFDGYITQKFVNKGDPIVVNP
jgi:multidrug efflux pump subunit AcrA (membrane-fusion protein)